MYLCDKLDSLEAACDLDLKDMYCLRIVLDKKDGQGTISCSEDGKHFKRKLDISITEKGKIDVKSFNGLKSTYEKDELCFLKEDNGKGLYHYQLTVFIGDHKLILDAMPDEKHFYAMYSMGAGSVREMYENRYNAQESGFILNIPGSSWQSCVYLLAEDAGFYKVTANDGEHLVFKYSRYPNPDRSSQSEAERRTIASIDLGKLEIREEQMVFVPEDGEEYILGQ